MGYGLAITASVALIGASAYRLVPLGLTEVLGFVTGAWCVWLVVRDNIWNWPVGLANSAFYIAVFWQARLFADASLQVVYLVLGVLGWTMWLKGGPSHGRLQVRRVAPGESRCVAACVVLGTGLGFVYLRSAGDAAPFLDALTTAMSLGAQYLLTRKFIENWHVWLVVDIVYVGLYASRNLWLTSILYAGYLVLALIGLQQWRLLLAVTGREDVVSVPPSRPATPARWRRRPPPSTDQSSQPLARR